jgi:hypothetical protein
MLVVDVATTTHLAAWTIGMTTVDQALAGR